MTSAHQALEDLCKRINDRKDRAPIPFLRYLELCAEQPERMFRNIFQVLADMVETLVGEGRDEYPDDPESINYVHYDCTGLFEEGLDQPFFADRLFANRLVHHISSFRQGRRQNRIYIFEGPHGSGKSTFLNNLLLKFERFTDTEAGASYETVWRLDRERLGATAENHAHALLQQLRGLAGQGPGAAGRVDPGSVLSGLSQKGYLEVPCPSHDHPFLLIPKPHRRDLLEALLPDGDFKESLFGEKQYDWVFRDQPCTICASLYGVLSERLDSPRQVYDMVFARRYCFARRLGEGISVFNPGDKITREHVLTNDYLQRQIDQVLQDSNRVRYLFSRYAKTNNGIYALMDIKSHNKERFGRLHGIISEGVHKVEDMEENVNSLFLALLNPEDRQNIAGTRSFTDRIIYIKVPYVLDYNTEVKIYLNVYGNRVREAFLPRVLQNFAKVIISTRLRERSEALWEWIPDAERYALYCDRNLHLLKMDIYAGLIPPWLSEEDRKRFTAARRRRIIGESEHEGDRGFSGRDSIRVFNEFLSAHGGRGRLIDMQMVCAFFKKHRKDLPGSIPEGFLDSLRNSYDYAVLQEVKESLFDFNEAEIARDIQNYLFAVNFDPGSVVRCVYTGDELEITDAFFFQMESRLLGDGADAAARAAFRSEVQQAYASRALTQEMQTEGKDIRDTEIYGRLYERYVYKLKEKVLDPFLENDNFRRAVKDYGSPHFKTYDRRIREEVGFLMKNLQHKQGYTAQGAREVCIYVIDQDLAQRYAVPPVED